MPTLQAQAGTGALKTADGSIVNLRTGNQSDLIVSELHAPYYEQVDRGNVFTLSLVTAAAITAYVGAAAGTPMLGVFNPTGSGKNLVLLQANFADVVAASAAGTATFGIYYGATAAITQATVTNPTSALTQLASGSVATGFRNVALTGSTAATNVLPIGSYYWATAAGAIQTPNAAVEPKGTILIPPGSYMALGGSAALTSATWIGSLTWEEVLA